MNLPAFFIFFLHIFSLSKIYTINKLYNFSPFLFFAGKFTIFIRVFSFPILELIIYSIIIELFITCYIEFLWYNVNVKLII